MSIVWHPISEAKRDGTEYLLWLEQLPPGSTRKGFVSGFAIQGWWSPSGEGWETVMGAVGKPTFFSDVASPYMMLHENRSMT